MTDRLQPGKDDTGSHPKPSPAGHASGSRHPDAERLNAFAKKSLPEHERRSRFLGWNLLWITVPALALLFVFAFRRTHVSSMRHTMQVANTPSFSRPLAGQASTCPTLPQASLRHKSAPEKDSEKPLETGPSLQAGRAERVRTGRHEADTMRRRSRTATRDSTHYAEEVPANKEANQSSKRLSASQTSSVKLAPPSGSSTRTDASEGPLSSRADNGSLLSQTPAQVASPAAQSAPRTLNQVLPPIADATNTPQHPVPMPQQTYGATPGGAESAVPFAKAVDRQEARSRASLIKGKVPDAFNDPVPGPATRNVPGRAPGSVSDKTAPLPTQSPLPSGLAVKSVAASVRRRIALDSHNQLFFSEDEGRHWVAVPAAWRDRAMSAATIPISLVPSRVPALALSIPEQYTRGAIATAELDTDPTTSLSGVVTDPSGAAITGATVVATDRPTGVIRNVRTDKTGYYLVEELPPGVYRLEAQSPGFQKQSQIAVVSAVEQSVKNLVLSASQNSQAVATAASSGQLNTSSENQPPAAPKARKKPPLGPVDDLVPVFVITTETGDRWTSPDGLTWKHE